MDDQKPTCPAIRGICRWIRDSCRSFKLSCQNLIQQITRLCTKTKPGYAPIDQASLDEERAETNFQIGEFYQERIAHLQSENSSLSEQNRRLQQEKHDALSRLSELMSLKLRDGNPNLVDLSDEYRPTKLAELSGELYDNEWTNAYEFLETNTELKDTSEQQRIQFLLDVLLETYEFCKTVCEKEWEFMALRVWGGNAIIKTEEQKMLKDVRKKNAKERLPDIEKQCLDKLEVRFKSYKSYFKGEALLDYVKGCVKLCWLMQFQDPPVAFVCPGWKSRHIVSMVNPVSCSQNHNLQLQVGQDEGEKENQSNPKLGNTARNIDHYEIMSGKSITPNRSEDEIEIVLTSRQPTGSLVSEETQDNGKDKKEKATGGSKEKKMLFDRGLLKEFTKKGNFIDFIVWPIMYLYEGGPILRSGVAQGCN